MRRVFAFARAYQTRAFFLVAFLGNTPVSSWHSACTTFLYTRLPVLSGSGRCQVEGEGFGQVQESRVYTVAVAGPDDVGPVARLFDSGALDPADVIGLIAQTEGDGFARGYASLRLQKLFAERLAASDRDIAERLPMLMIGGTAGLMCPHVTLFVRRQTANKGQSEVARLSIGVAQFVVFCFVKPEDGKAFAPKTAT
jgi:hypothetical protein